MKKTITIINEKNEEIELQLPYFGVVDIKEDNVEARMLLKITGDGNFTAWKYFFSAQTGRYQFVLLKQDDLNIKFDGDLQNIVKGKTVKHHYDREITRMLKLMKKFG